MTRVAVIGTGAMGANHVRVYREMPDVELVAIVDKDQAKAESVSKPYLEPAYDKYLVMLEREQPQAVSIVVPTVMHYTVTRDCLEAGCHVLVEKPLAASLEHARELIETAAQLERVLMVGHIERYNPAITELKRQLTAGKLGRVFQIHTRRLGPFPTRVHDVGVVMDLATHDLDIMRYLTGSEAVRVYAETRRELHPVHEDLFAGMLRFEDGTLGTLEINWLTPAKIREVYVTGERGMYRVDYITQDLHFFENAEANGDDWAAMHLLRGVSEGSVTKFAIHKREPLRAELEAFIAKIQGSGSLVANGHDGYAAMSLACAMADSAASVAVKLLYSETHIPT